MSHDATPKRITLPMICICRQQIEGTENYDESRLIKADELRAKAKRALSVEFEREITDGDFLTFALWSLNEHGMVVDFAADQWLGLSASSYGYTGGQRELKHRVNVQCDRAEDGLAALVIWFAERAPVQD